MNISQREISLSIITLAIILIGSGWYIVDSRKDHWEEMAQEKSALEQQINVHQNAIQLQINWMDQLEDLQEQLPVFSTDQASVAPELVKTIKQIAVRHGVEILRTTPYKETPTGDLFEVGINCTWEGPLKALIEFLTDLQQQGVRYDARSLNISPAGNNTTNLRGNMIIHCAFIRQPKFTEPAQ